MATNDTKISITVNLADVKQIPLNINPADEKEYRNAEQLVNALWSQWVKVFNGKASSQEIMARVAFQFARLYLQAHEETVVADKFLKDFEEQLNDVVVKM